MALNPQETLEHLRTLINSPAWETTYRGLLDRLKKQRRTEQEQTLRNPQPHEKLAAYQQGVIDGITLAEFEPQEEIKRINPSNNEATKPGY